MPGPTAPATGEMNECQLAGYLGIGVERVPEEYNAGLSMHMAAWPLVETYRGEQFQAGLVRAKGKSAVVPGIV